ncbi:hypothetical protein ACW95P_04840 [Candidatus Mycoplasma pogonae]
MDVVIFKVKGFFSANAIDEKNRKRFEFIKSGKMIFYNNRQSATIHTQRENQDLINEFLNSNLTIEEYYKKLIASKNDYQKKHLFTFDGKEINDINQKDAADKCKELKNDQFVWEAYLSLGDVAKKNFVISEKEFLKHIQATLPAFFKKEDLNIENLNVFINVQADNGKLHAHLLWFEKDKTFLNQRTGQKQFKKVGQVKKENMRKIEDLIKIRVENGQNINVLQDQKKSIWIERKKIKDIIKADVNKNTLLASDPDKKKLEIIGSSMLKNGSYVYKKLDPEVKKFVWDIFENIKNNNLELNNQWTEYKKLFNAAEKSKHDYFKDFIINEKKELESQIGNAITKAIFQDLLNNSQKRDVLGYLPERSITYPYQLNLEYRLKYVPKDYEVEQELKLGRKVKKLINDLAKTRSL